MICTRFCMYLILLYVFLTAGAYAESPVSDTELCLADIFCLNISVASGGALEQSPEESPAIISVITRSMIESFGCRSLNDVLQLVPGFVQGGDVQGISGWAMRGIWAAEGKILFLEDGHPLNEALYGNPVSAAMLFADQIERIEIIRGPGSAMYGGFAEYGVVNIITRSDNRDSRLALRSRGATTQSGPSWGGGSIHSELIPEGDSLPSIHITLLGGAGIRSDRTITTQDNEVSSLRDNGHQNALHGNLQIDHKGFRFGLIADRFVIEEPFPSQQYYAATEAGYPDAPIRTWSTAMEGFSEYRADLSPRMHVSALLSHRISQPWQTDNAAARHPANDWWYAATINQTTGGLRALAEPMERLSIIAGAEGTQQTMVQPVGLSAWAQPAKGGTSMEEKNAALYAQITGTLPLVGLVGGLRCEQSGTYGSSIVPRFAAVFQKGRGHIKALFSAAMRSPTLENLRTTPSLKPEYTNISEFEAGFQFSPGAYAGFNIFRINARDVICTQESDNTLGYTYINSPHLSSDGIEAELRYSAAKWFVSGNFSTSFITQNTVADYRNWTRLPGTGGVEDSGTSDAHTAFGMPQAKGVIAGGGTLLNGHLHLGSTAVVLSSRRYRYESYLGTDAEGYSLYTEHITTLPESIQWNIHAGSDCGIPGLMVDVSIRNLLNTDIAVPPGYYQGHRASPGMSREYALTLGWDMQLGKH